MTQNRIVIDPGIRQGKPVIRGTRVPVDLILGSLAGGMTPDEVAREYGITKEDISAALAYASEIMGGEEVTPPRR